MFFLLMGTQLEDYHGQFSITSISGVPPQFGSTALEEWRQDGNSSSSAVTVLLVEGVPENRRK